MSKVYLLLICLLLAPFTGCIEDSALETTEKVDETDNTEEKTEERPTDQWTFYRDFGECDADDNALVAYSEFVDCLNTDLINDGESVVSASSEFAHEVFNIADLDMDGNLTPSEFVYIKNYPHEAEEEVEDTPSLRSAVDKYYNYYGSNNFDEEGICGMIVESDGRFLNSSSQVDDDWDDLDYTFEECVDEYKEFLESAKENYDEWNITYRNYTEEEVMDFQGVVREVTLNATTCLKETNSTEWDCWGGDEQRMLWALVDGKWGYAENGLRDYCKSDAMTLTERLEDNQVFQCEIIEANLTLPVDKISDGYSGHYIIEVIAISERHNLSSYSWYLLDNMGNTYDGGKVYGINMNYSGDDEVLQNRSINISNDKGGWRFPAHFLDNDLDGMLSAGDQFLLYDTDYDRYGQTRSLEDGYSFRLRLDVTGDVVHYDMVFGNMNKDISGDS